MKIKVAPSILAANFANLDKEIRLIDDGECDSIHCDIMDGHFVPNISFGSDIVKSIRNISKKYLDVHLMINNAENYINQFVNAGADNITFHIESTKDPLLIINEIKKFNVNVGIAIKPNTDLKEIMHIIDNVDLILIMTVEPGFGGQKFLNSQLKKINEVRNIVTKNSYKIDIQVDGGINNVTAQKCKEAGANILVAGSYIFNCSKKDYKQKINSLR
tara:strand:+ start:92 stop:742 length:651 start_codon:yes stop_codon:yes gene_type:complete